MAGMGFTFIPEFAVTMPGLEVRPLIEPEIVRTIQVVTVHGRPHAPAVGAFVREILAFPWANATRELCRPEQAIAAPPTSSCAGRH